MAFTADLNPKSTKSMDFLDMMKMEDYLGRQAKPAKNTATPAANAILAKPEANDIIKSNMDDAGVPFKFGNNYQKD